MTYTAIIQDLIAFLESSPTAWHAVEVASRKLTEAGFRELAEEEEWNLLPRHSYFVKRNGSSLCAFITPASLPKRLRLLASHTDSPALKLKPQCEIRKLDSLLLGVEVYGSPLLTSWFNRDLGIAGRVLFTDFKKTQIQEALVNLDRYPLTIPQLAIHLDREVNDRGIQLNKQDHLNALAAIQPTFKTSYIETLLKEEFSFDHLIAHELFLYPLEKPRLVGYDNSLIAAYRIDSLASMHASLTALISNSEPLEEEIKMVIFWDNEEVGSHTAQGADSPFFNQLLERITLGFHASREHYFTLLNRSICISVDLAHAIHPNYPEKHDAYHHPFLGKGVVIKSHAGQRYATNIRSAMPVYSAASMLKISLQHFASRNDIPCGTTIGPLQAAISGMPTVDIGCGQLSMHSCRELMSCQDHYEMVQLLNQLLVP